MAGRPRRRRPDGEGTVYEFRPGSWLAQVRVDGRRLSATGPSAEAARQRLAEKLERESLTAAGGAARRTGAPTVSEYLVGWLDGLRAGGVLRPSAWRRYESIVRLHLVPVLGAIRLDELRRGDVLELLHAARAGRTSGRAQGDTSLHHIHAVLHRALRQAVADGLVEGNVARLVDAPAMHHREKVILTAAQAGRLLRAARGARLEAAIVLGIATGMREGEILGLRPADVDLEAGCLRVRRSAGLDFDGRPVLGEPRTARGRRRIELPAVAVAALRAHLARLPAGSRTLFCSATGRILPGPTFLRHHFHPVLRAAGLPPMPFSDLRHSAATILREMGVDGVTLSELLGHSTPAVTSRMYGHVDPRPHSVAAVRMDAALAEGETERPAPVRRRRARRLAEALGPLGGGASWIPVSDEPAAGSDGKPDGKHLVGRPARRQGLARADTASGS